MFFVLFMQRLVTCSVPILALYQSEVRICILVLAGAMVSNFAISNFAPPPIMSLNEVAMFLARATVVF